MENQRWQSPFSDRYPSLPGLALLFGKQNQHLTWRKVWVALAEAQCPELVSKDNLARIRMRAADVDLQQTDAEEVVCKHDVVAELLVFQRQVGSEGKYLHMGATSSDIKDNAEMLLIREGLATIMQGVYTLELTLLEKATLWLPITVVGFTHLQPAEYLPAGLRFLVYAQDILNDMWDLYEVFPKLQGKGFKGATGSYLSYLRLYGNDMTKVRKMERRALQSLGLMGEPVSRQTYSRSQDTHVLQVLATLAADLSKIATDLRLLRAPLLGQLRSAPPVGRIGSSAMPYKQNPVAEEKVCSLARLVAAAAQVAWENQASNWLERSLDDSANRRSILFEPVLVAGEMLRVLTRSLRGVYLNMSQINMQKRELGDKVGLAALLQWADTTPGAKDLRVAIATASNRTDDINEILAELDKTGVCSLKTSTSVIAQYIDFDMAPLQQYLHNIIEDYAVMAESIVRPGVVRGAFQGG